MQYEITNRADGFRVTDDITAYVEDEVAKLGKFVGDAPDDLLLRVVVEDGGNSNNFKVQLRLSLPGHIFVSHEPGPEFRTAAERAFKELRRQVQDDRTTRRDQQRQRGG